MKYVRRAKLFSYLPLLNRSQRLPVMATLLPAGGLDKIIALIDELGSADRCCPHCESRQWRRHGQANKRQRFRCCHCRRTFNDLTGTPLARLRLRGKWPDYLNALIEGRSVRAAADQVGVHPNTAFRWRHRFLDQIGTER
jgi:transposase-like protein